MRKRAGALYIRDHELLLICEGGQGFYWTPGGGLEKSESFDEALKRELVEELDAKLLSAEPYISYEDIESDEHVNYYLVTMELPKVSPNDIKFCWYSRDDYETNEIPISKRVYSLVYPRLMNDKLV